jgi:hypothetical protein
MPEVLFSVAAGALLDISRPPRANLEEGKPTLITSMAKRAREGGKTAEETAAPRAVQTREVFLLDELGRFVAGATAQGVPVMEGMVPKKALALARLAIAGSEFLPPKTTLGAAVPRNARDSPHAAS